MLCLTSGGYDSSQMVRAHCDMQKSELKLAPRIPRMASDGTEEEYMKILEMNGLSSCEFAINYGIESIIITFVKELIRQGLVVCEIKDAMYDPKRIYIELSAVVGMPKITHKRLDIDVTK